MGLMSSDVARDAICLDSDLAEVVADRVFVFDRHLRVRLANQAFLDAFCGDKGASVCGRSLGEILDCRRIVEGCACGGTNACAGCGWLQAVNACRRGEDVGSREFRVLTQAGTAFDFTATVRPVRKKSGGEPAWVCGLHDTFAQKRLMVQERTFFHDVLNLAAGVRGLCELAADAEGAPDKELMRLIRDGADNLVDEIQRLRKLRVAENGDLELFEEEVAPGEILRGVVARVKDEAAARHLEVIVADGAEGVPVVSDREVLSLIVGDLFRNAVEASSPGERITLSCGVEEGSMVFRIRNPALLAADVRDHVFERSFTTRGSGKGVGAYRAKLLGEKYLKGKITFISQEPEGTVVSFAVPLGGTAWPA